MANLAGNALRRAAGRLTWRALPLEWVGSLLAILLAFAWLQIADSHVWQFAFSIVTGAVLVVAFFWLQMRVFRMRRLPRPLAPFWSRFAVCFALLCLWLLLLYLIGGARNHASLYAGYWNSKLSPGLRNFFTFERLVSWQRIFWDLVQWALAAFLLVIAVEGGTAGLSAAAWRRISGVYRHWLYWLVAIVFGLAGAALVGALVNWMPGIGKGVALETASVLIRLGVAYTCVIVLLMYVASLAAVYLDW